MNTKGLILQETAAIILGGRTGDLLAAQDSCSELCGEQFEALRKSGSQAPCSVQLSMTPDASTREAQPRTPASGPEHPSEGRGPRRPEAQAHLGPPQAASQPRAVGCASAVLGAVPHRDVARVGPSHSCTGWWLSCVWDVARRYQQCSGSWSRCCSEVRVRL